MVPFKNVSSEIILYHAKIWTNFFFNRVNPGARIVEGQGTRNTTKNYIYELLLE